MKNMNTLNNTLSSKWRATRWFGGWGIETVDQFYELKKDGTPKKGVKPRNLLIGFHFSKSEAQYICDIHNLFLAQDKSEFLKEEAKKAIQQLMQRYGIDMKTISSQPKKSP